MGKTAKENYLCLGRGEMPDYVPFGGPYKDRIPTAMAGPFEVFMPKGMSFFPAPGATPPTEFVDLWGVPHVATKETGYAALPKPGVFILEDIRDWRRVVKHPLTWENYDLEAMAKKQLEPVDRSQTAVSMMFSMQSPFQQLCGFMGHTEALVAMHEEPEAVHELLDYLMEWYEPLVVKSLDVFKPDLLGIADDTATKDYPFFSVAMYREFFKPFYSRIAKHATDRGVWIEFHNCGRCEDFIPDMLDFGVRYWNPAQTTNDLLGIKEKHRGRLVICGGFDFVPPVDREVTEEEVRQSVREAIDKYAPGGGYVFMGGIMGSADTPELNQKVAGWLADEAYNYGSDFYKK
ncbi:MAG: veratrol--corrinoid protein metyltransferase [Treponema sp.]|nr:veratrol--corrinoid protein metyltransferase [Treponema sp.]